MGCCFYHFLVCTSIVFWFNLFVFAALLEIVPSARRKLVTIPVVIVQLMTANCLSADSLHFKDELLLSAVCYLVAGKPLCSRVHLEDVQRGRYKFPSYQVMHDHHRTVHFLSAAYNLPRGQLTVYDWNWWEEMPSFVFTTWHEERFDYTNQGKFDLSMR